MAMQHTPLLMSNILDRGATVAPYEEIVTLTESGVRRQTYRETRDRAHQLAHALAAQESRLVIESAPLCGMARAIWRLIMQSRAWAQCCIL